ncbi:hypothetical protein ABZ816_34055 [Actinosynnema sp. NPDC047251]|uniref:Putative secreted protein n=1 Tax=Saccharothrix espanaensis (strain ATCC 51144 / DSM 44229 / JCM 9112 / NBRC 15066 / NRRL 15764) TaxID=1179773 RepID=K0K5X0_SACES|nr:hypothetical protein [Saccharothrix espanaensis]CCH32274.1 putative secreted protein [Saccharothrix espanaensis DSM 44229]
MGGARPRRRAGLPGTAGPGITAPPSGTGAASAGTAWWTLDRHVVSQPGLRTVVVALGANDIVAGAGKHQIVAQIKGLVHPTSAASLRNVRRGDRSVIHVIIATVPPLGLAADDPREVRRKQLNETLVSEYVNLGADGVLDLAGMVADSSSNTINPDLVTGGVPNARFHDTIARAVAAAVTAFPPLEL